MNGSNGVIYHLTSINVGVLNASIIFIAVTCRINWVYKIENNTVVSKMWLCPLIEIHYLFAGKVGIGTESSRGAPAIPKLLS